MKRTSSRIGPVALVLAVMLGTGVASAQTLPPEGSVPVPSAAGGMAQRTPAEKKISSQLLLASRAFAASRGVIPQGSEPEVQAFIDANVAPDQTTFVVIKADVSPELVAVVKATGAYDVEEFPIYGTITARVPITALVGIAQRSDVRSIGPKERVRTNRWIESPESLADLGGAIGNAGTVNWQGVTAHKANLVQSSGIDGTGVKVCVLSDGVNSLAARIADGNLPPGTAALPGQAGNGDEGTAMLEIIHDMAPGATLAFATAFTSEASFATNITSLQAAGCKIIVDDVTYFDEGAFQDGPVALAVNTVTTAGALYFSSAANSGNKTQAQSGTYEGDFVASAMAIPAFITAAETLKNGSLPPGGISLHQFPSGLNYTTLTGDTTIIDLKWSDQLGHSANDYDIIVGNSAGTAILCSWTGDFQTGTQDPVDFAFCNTGSFGVNARIYVIKYGSASVARALRIDTNRGRITSGDSTTGSTFGHNAAASGLTAAAIDVRPYGAGVFTAGAGVQVNFYSSDGPRKMFYNANGTAITPGNFLFGTGGGTTLSKVDLTAADCGATATSGFLTFCGTSAAAPTAASIAALVMSAKSSLTKAQITTAVLNSGLDIEAAGADRDSGVGIVMADSAVRGVLTLTAAKSFVPPSIASAATSVLTIQLTNTNSLPLTGVSFTDTYPAGVVNAASPNAGVSGAGCVATTAAAAGGGTLGITVATLPAGVMCTFTVTVTSSAAGAHLDSADTVNAPLGALTTMIPSATLTVTGGAGTTPVLQAIVSRKVHGGVGTFDLPLTFTTPPTINHAPTTEPRQGPAQTVVFTFDKPLNAATVAITEGAATAGAPSFSGNSVIVGLTNVTNQQYVTVSLTNVASTDGGTGGVAAARIGFLVGDVNASRTISVADVGLVNAVLAQPVDMTNYLKDVNVSGTLSVADKAITNANLTKALPAP
jgi:hypothetical protein